MIGQRDCLLDKTERGQARNRIPIMEIFKPFEFTFPAQMLESSGDTNMFGLIFGVETMKS